VGAGEPGAYNLGGDGEVSLGDVARATGTRSIPIPSAVATAASAALARLPMVPSAAEWIHIARTSVVMDTTRAKTKLGWQPAYTSRQTLDALAASLT
jgi:UDP-glucose 4-epimerase